MCPLSINTISTLCLPLRPATTPAENHTLARARIPTMPPPHWPPLHFARRRTSSAAGASDAPASEVGASPAPRAESPSRAGYAPRSSSPPLVLLTTVDVGGGRMESVTVTDGDDVVAAAAAFCGRHGLPPSVAAPLTAHLESNLASARAARGRSASASPAAAAVADRVAAAVGGGARPSPLGAARRLPPVPAGLLRKEVKESVDIVTVRATATAAVDVAPPAQAVEEVARVPTPPHLPAIHTTPPPAAPPSPPSSTGLLTAHQHAAAAAASLGPFQVSPPPRGRATPTSAAAAAATHDRLYTQARLATDRADARRAAALAAEEAEVEVGRVRPTWVSAQLAATRGPGPFEDYAHRLYAEGLSSMKAREAASAAAAAAAAAKEVDGATWTPAISAAARRARRAGPAWDRLASTPARRPTVEARVESLREEAAAAELKECTFAPKVSAASARLMASRAAAQAAHRVPTHDALYHDAERRRQRLEEAAAGPKSVGGVGASSSAPPFAVADRLAARAARAAAKVAAARAAAETPTVDPTTGQTLFAPKTGRPPSVGRNAGRLPVGEYLYAKGAASAARRARAEADATAAAEAAAMARATPRSQELMARLRVRRFRQIHRYLVQGGGSSAGGSSAPSPRGATAPSTDLPPLDLHAAVANDGLMASMDPEVAADVRSAAASATTRGARGPFSLAEFSALMDAAVRGSGPRSYLQPRTRRGRPAGDASCTFAPTILPQSAALAVAAGRRPAGVDAVAALAADAASTAARLAAARAQVEAAVLAECTFEPALVAKQRKGGHGVAIAAATAPAPTSPKLAKYEQLSYELDAVLAGGAPPEGGWLSLAAAGVDVRESPPRSPVAASAAALRELAARRAAAVRSKS